jgi:hypothetical protein
MLGQPIESLDRLGKPLLARWSIKLLGAKKLIGLDVMNDLSHRVPKRRGLRRREVQVPRYFVLIGFCGHNNGNLLL